MGFCLDTVLYSWYIYNSFYSLKKTSHKDHMLLFYSLVVYGTSPVVVSRDS